MTESETAIGLSPLPVLWRVGEVAGDKHRSSYYLC
jgi:hypothetical protein